MFEYEFRWAVACEWERALDILRTFSSGTAPVHCYVFYAAPHFRLKSHAWEIKQKVSSYSVYHDSIWFQWVKSCEIPYHEWTWKMHEKFTRALESTQHPIAVETRWQLDWTTSGVKVFAFQKENGESGLVFESEVGTFSDPWPQYAQPPIATHLGPYAHVYKKLKGLEPLYSVVKPAHHPVRKSVRPVLKRPKGPDILVARKYDGVFGFIFSYPDRIVEFWEGHVRRILNGTTLGHAMVLGAEKMAETVILLDVYRVQGSTVLCSASVLLEFLPSLTLPPGYRIQKYYRTVQELNQHPEKDPSDGLIFHDTVRDCIYKLKSDYTLDLVFRQGYFILPNHTRIKTPYPLREGRVYECSIRNQGCLVPLRERTDRFTGNTFQQIQRILNLLNLKLT